jgi:outer membrane lipoprotein SlyB
MRRMVILFTVLALGACATQRQERTATTGAIVGAAAGAAIGSQTNNTANGALIGGMLGAAAGAVIGASDAQPQPVYYPAPRYHRPARGEHDSDRRYRRED